jgi:hypothetical protein
VLKVNQKDERESERAELLENLHKADEFPVHRENQKKVIRDG